MASWFNEFFSGSNQKRSVYDAYNDQDNLQELPNMLNLPNLNQDIYGGEQSQADECYETFSQLPNLNEEYVPPPRQEYVPAHDSQPWNFFGGQTSQHEDCSGGPSYFHQTPDWEPPYDGTRPGSSNFRVEELPSYGTPSASYQLPTVESPYYVTSPYEESEPPKQVPDYVQVPVQVKLEPSDDEGNRYGGGDDDDNYDHDYIREATVSYETDDVFDSADAMTEWVVKRGLEHGCKITKRRSIWCGYHGTERFKLIKLISQSGASYVGAMNSSTTHLVCYKFEGKKYEFARKLNKFVVNHRWIEECINQGKRVSEQPYMKQCGFEVGPLLLEAPNAVNEVTSVLGEISTTKNISKTPVIDVDSGDDKWTDSSLLKENLLPDTKQNKNSSDRLKRKDTKRSSRREWDDLPTNKYCLDKSSSPGLKIIEKKKNTTISEPSKRSRKLIQKSIYSALKSTSDSEDDVQDTEVVQNHGKRRTLILDEIEDLDPTSNHQDHSAGVDQHEPRLSKEALLSCVICWTDFSSTRGVLPCGHRFCFSCIQNWADHMVSMKKVSTCPLCKASFHSIQKMEDAESFDQKIYSQTIPNHCPVKDVYILSIGASSTRQILPPPTPVCFQCRCREPEELLISCYSCHSRCVHSYCLDPPQTPWVCVQCKYLRMRCVR